MVRLTVAPRRTSHQGRKSLLQRAKGASTGRNGRSPLFLDCARPDSRVMDQTIRRNGLKLGLGALVSLLALSSCGSAKSTSPTTAATVTTAAAPTGLTVSTTTTAAPTTTSSTTTTSTATTTTTAVPTTTALPGEPIPGPAAGARLSVVGVAYDDILYVLTAPGEDQPTVSTLAPTFQGAVATGRGRSLPRSQWWEVTIGAQTGWASARYLAYRGVTVDATAAIVAKVGGYPTARTMEKLGALVASGQGGSGDESPAVVMSVAPTPGDLGEVTFDVIGIADDSIRGYRLHVFGQPETAGKGFVLKSVEQTTFCSRGGGGNGLCI